MDVSLLTLTENKFSLAQEQLKNNEH